MSASAAASVATWRARDASSRRLSLGIVVSVVLHVLLAAAFVVKSASSSSQNAPPVYKVDLVAAPPGPRAIGEVSSTPAAATPTPPTPKPDVTPPPRAEAKPNAMPLPNAKKQKLAPVSTPVPPKDTKTKATRSDRTPKLGPLEPLPKAGGGPQGGKGADVANVHTGGLDFPFPGYLHNIVNQVAVRFSPPKGSSYVTDVAFLIHRDGSVSDVRIVKRSGSYAFDLESRGAVESAGAARAFGPLPSGFRDDVLPVTFSFDPSVIR